MRQLLITLGIGLTSGVLSGAFGIGGGIITTPAIRLILGAPSLIAVGTPLPVIFPSALTGAINYARDKLVDVRVGVTCGLIGSVAAVLGAWATRLVGGNVVLIATAALILYTAADMVLQIVRPPRVGLAASEERDAFCEPEVVAQEAGARVGEGSPSARDVAEAASLSVRAEPGSEGAPLRPPGWRALALIGITAGFYSGFLGLGGGFVLVPMLTRWLHFPIKRAIATSLLAITILAVPGTITHALLGHIDWGIALWLSVGVVPGAWIGSRITLGAADRSIRLGFALLLIVVGAWLGIATLAGGRL
jgi:uncharacterized membrane protein YfcA